MPELPEVEITVRRLDAALRGARIESARAPGMVALKSIKPPLDALAGAEITAVRRIGKMPIVELSTAEGDLAMLIHMMSAGRLQLFNKRASLRDKRSRILIRIESEGEELRELRLREFGTKQRAWGKLLAADAVEGEEMVATLGLEAWPAPAPGELADALDQPRHLHPMLRDQRTIAGIGRSWVDEILWDARLSPFKKGSELDDGELERLHSALAVLGGAIDHYEEVVGESIPDKMPMPLQVHRREGEPCPRCGETIAAIHYSEHITCYCPAEQNGGKRFADRRLSRLLK
ncbi:MAG TPA: DNA-formamidopyrimidine glycosylase family protein [Solirubrobacterales bacterium]|nr:DNA-formamidopyrimidine glycosylase family protein [Solirubrobacterales bacterium]